MKNYQFSFPFIAIISFSSLLQAEVVLDGSLGASGALTGPNYAIEQGLGQTAGNNLFHSFSAFNLEQSESATFSGANNIQNIISRISGGDPSFINGKIASTINGADMFFLNPAGMVFGEHASLDLSGSFHVSSADYMTFDGDDIFYAQPLEGEVLSSSPPASFGFLDTQDKDIEISGSILHLNDGEHLSLVGGDLHIDNEADIYVPSGQINIVSIRGKGEIPIDLSNGVDANFGTVIVENGSLIEVSNSGNTPLGAGSIYIKAGQFQLKNSSGLRAGSDSDMDGGVIFISAENITISERSSIVSITEGKGDGTDIELDIGNFLFITEGGGFANNVDEDGGLAEVVGIVLHTKADGQAGNLNISANEIRLNNKASIDTASFASGDGGTISLDVKGDIRLIDDSTIFADSHGEGLGGIILIEAESMHLSKGSHIDVGSYNIGHGGEVFIALEGNLTIRHSGVFSSASQEGNAGSISIIANKLDVESGFVDVGTDGSGNGGNIFVTTTNSITLDDSKILSSTSNSGRGGNIEIKAKNLYLQNESVIDSSAVEALEIIEDGKVNDVVYAKNGTGDAGLINISVTDSLILNNESIIQTASYWDFENNEGISGNAGNIDISAGNNVNLSDFSAITSESINAGGGRLNINAGEQLYLADSWITSSVEDGVGNGGDINIDAGSYVILNISEVIAQAYQGSGGNINIKTLNHIESTDSLVDASSQLGIDGTVEIEAPSIETDSSVQVLSTRYLDTRQWQQQPCAARNGGEVSRFVVANKRGVPNMPDDMMSASIDGLAANGSSVSIQPANKPGYKPLQVATAGRHYQISCAQTL